MSKPYKSGTYIYPPRPEFKISSESLYKYDTGEYLAQPKLNGSCAELYIKSTSFYVKNRHKGGLTNFKLNNTDVLPLHRKGGEMLLVGEYMNKNQNDKSGKPWNHKFVIFDILVLDDQHLIGTTYQERLVILHELFGTEIYDDYLYKISENIYMVRTFDKDFLNFYNKIVQIDMLEGLVLKKKNGKLEQGTREKNNVGWSIKARKQNKNYSF